MIRFVFPPTRRLRLPREFQRVYDLGQRAGDGWLLLFAARNDLGLTRIGLSVSRKQGNSVRRQRLKRLLREAYRLSQHEIPEGFDLILIPRANTDATLNDFKTSLVRLAGKLARRLSSSAEVVS